MKQVYGKSLHRLDMLVSPLQPLAHVPQGATSHTCHAHTILDHITVRRTAADMHAQAAETAKAEAHEKKMLTVRRAISAMSKKLLRRFLRRKARLETKKALHWRKMDSLTHTIDNFDVPDTIKTTLLTHMPTRPSITPVHAPANEHTAPAHGVKHTPFAHHALYAKCVGVIMSRGNKSKAIRLVNAMCQHVQEWVPQMPVMEVLRIALEHVKPAFELRKARIGAKTQFIPGSMHANKQLKVALRALVQQARLKRKGKQAAQKAPHMYSFAYVLAQEVHQAYLNKGQAVQAKYATHKQAAQNQHAIRRRWW